MKTFFLQMFMLLLTTTLLIGQTPTNLTSNDPDFFPEDITIVGNIVYISGLGDGSVQMFDLDMEEPEGMLFAEAEEGYTQAWGLKSDGTVLVSILNNADFTGGPSGPSKLVEYDLASSMKTGEWDLPAGAIGHTVSIVDGKYYVTDFGMPRIMEIDPATDTVNDTWFTSDDWDPAISGIGGTLYHEDGAFYVSQGNKLWYLPVSGGMPGTLEEVNVDGLDIIDADGISWGADQNTIYYATNDTGDPADAGTVYRLVFSDATNATGSIIATGFDDSSGLWYYANDGSEYVFVLESQFGGLFGINSFDPPFNIEIILLEEEVADPCETNPLTVVDSRICENGSATTYDVVVTIVGGTAPYQVTGDYSEANFMGDEALTFSITDGEGYVIEITDDNGCNEVIDRSDLVACTKLDVELINFSGTAESAGNLLTWTTANEFENDFFTLERAVDGINFSSINVIAGQGTVATISSYSFLDVDATNGISYYRLSQTDMDGSTLVLGVVSVLRSSNGFGTIALYPVPVQNVLNINLALDVASDVKVSVFDILGRSMSTTYSVASQGTLQLDTRAFPSGKYLLKIEMGNEVIVNKFVKD